MKFTALTFFLCSIATAFAVDTLELDAHLEQAHAQVAAIEPLKAPQFTRKHTAGLSQHRVTRWVDVNYAVSPAADMTLEALRARVAKLFHERGWIDGVPEDASATMIDNGVVTRPIAFRAKFEGAPNVFSIHHAYMWIGDKSIQCTYVFRLGK